MAKEKPKKDKEEKKKVKGISRRDMLKMSAMGAGASALTVITSRKGFATHGKAANLNSIFNQVPPDPTLCTKPTDSPITTPFVSALPIPPPAIPTILNPQPTLNSNTAAGEAPRCPHQDFLRFYPLAQYSISAQPCLHQYDPAIAASYTWGWNGIYPGPTFLNLYGIPTAVRIFNNLPETVTGFGINETTVHLHNGHTPSESDGFADDWFGTGLWKDNIYPNVYAGFTDGYGFEGPFPCIAEGDPLEAQRHYWYHDHRETYTSGDNLRGLNGQYLMYDCFDPGIEGLPAPSLNLPSGYGVFDIPLNFTDRLFCADGTVFGVPGAQVAQPAGDKFIVNGVIQPYLNVLARKYRFRMLNSGPTRIFTWNLAYVSGGTTTNPVMNVVSTDGNLLTSPVQVTTLPHHVAQRYDVVIDFSQFPVGSQIYLLNNQPQFVSGGTEPSPLPSGADFPIEDVVMMFQVTGTATDTSSLPDTLAPGYPAKPTPSGTMVWNFDLINGQFHINGLLFDPCTPQIQIPQNTAMLWTIQNFLPNAGWVHPVHIHFEEQRVLSRLGPPDPTTGIQPTLPPIGVESGRKDVNPIPGGNQCNLYLQFRDFIGKYLIHCHNMNHEDNYMMARWDIIPSGGSLPSCYTCGDEQSSAQNFFIPKEMLDPNEVVAGTPRAQRMIAEVRRENIIKKFANRAYLKEVLS